MGLSDLAHAKVDSLITQRTPERPRPWIFEVDLSPDVFPAFLSRIHSIFAIRLWGVGYTQVGYETLGSQLPRSVRNVGLPYSTRSLFQIPLFPRTPLPHFIPAYIFSN